MTKRKRNPNDSTFRNINALKKRVAALEREAKAIRIQFNTLRRYVRRETSL